MIKKFYYDLVHAVQESKLIGQSVGSFVKKMFYDLHCGLTKKCQKNFCDKPGPYHITFHRNKKVLNFFSVN